LIKSERAGDGNSGDDLWLITFGAQILNALDAADNLEKSDGLSVEVIDLRSLAPLDKEAILATVKKTNRVMILHEASLTGGIGGELSAIIAEEAFEWLDAPVIRVASIDSPVPFAPQMEDYYLPQISEIVEAARRLAAY